MKNQTKKDYENYLNEMYSDILGDYCAAFQQFEHFANKDRGKHCSRQTIISNYNNETLGTLQRNYDSIAFEVGYNDWKR